MEYYNILPNEAKLQLLAEADYFIIRELCQEPIFKNICNSKLLWQEKLEREFGLSEVENGKEKYLKLLRAKLRKERDDIVRKIREIATESFAKINKNQPFHQGLIQANKIQQELGINELIEKRKILEDKIEKINIDLPNSNILFIPYRRGENIQNLKSSFRGIKPKEIILITDRSTKEKYFSVIFENFYAAENVRSNLIDVFQFEDKK